MTAIKKKKVENDANTAKKIGRTKNNLNKTAHLEA